MADLIVGDLRRQARDFTEAPIGRVLVGQAGIGKTHFVGVLRRKAWANGCWFVLLDVIGITDFWKSAALSFVTSLLQTMPNGARQCDAVLDGVVKTLGGEDEAKAAFRNPGDPAKGLVDRLRRALVKRDDRRALPHGDVFRALTLLRAEDKNGADIAHAWLQGFDSDEERRKALGLIRPPPTPVELVRGMSWLMGLSGPTLIALDQIDGVINSGAVAISTDPLAEKISFADLLSSGLLQLHGTAMRCQTVLTCLPDSWRRLQQGVQAFKDRFEPEPAALTPLLDADAIEGLIASRLTPAYRDAAFTPPSPTWPFSAAAVEDARGMMPRQILMACEKHRRACLEAGAVSVCDRLSGDDLKPIPDGRETGLDAAFDAAQKAAVIEGLLDDSDAGGFGRLLQEVLELYPTEIEPPSSVDVASQSDPAQRKPPLHGRVTFTFREENDREHHVCFRAIEQANANAYIARLRAAVTAAGIGRNIPGRDLVVIRRLPVPAGPKTQQLQQDFLQLGGKLVDPVEDDMRRLVALRDMHDVAKRDSDQPRFEAWLRQRKPLCATALFMAAGLCPPPLAAASPPPPQAPKPEPQPAPPPGDHSRPASDAIPVGHRLTGGELVTLPTGLLPRHTAIIAGAGSGKTVLLRRIVEEAALTSIPAIVIDPNNDLARLGDKWPEPPASFTADDAGKAARYAEAVEVIVWTPGMAAGNPLFLSVLPDFALLGEDEDERWQAVTMAAETIGPLAGAKSNQQKGVLSDALRHYAGHGGGTLDALIALLADLPDGVSAIGSAGKHADKMANELRASIANNILLKANGPVLEPKLLFYGAQPGRTRVSVINLSGLASATARDDFVNRLQMTLFAWIKRHPSPRGMLYVIDEAQIFIPAVGAALAKTSGVQLVAQARKYGLGMIVATQAPRGIDNKVVSNCTTQFLGKQNAPATIDAAKELIAASGGRADDLGKLATGEFYFKTERSGKPFKLKTPVCLSWHPSNPPDPAEVQEKAKRSKAAM